MGRWGEYHTLPNIVQMSSRASKLSSSACLIYSFHVSGAKMVLISNHSYCSAGTFQGFLVNTISPTQCKMMLKSGLFCFQLVQLINFVCTKTISTFRFFLHVLLSDKKWSSSGHEKSFFPSFISKSSQICGESPPTLVSSDAHHLDWWLCGCPHLPWPPYTYLLLFLLLKLKALFSGFGWRMFTF